VLLPRAVLDGIAAGTVTLAFRRWRRPTVRAGGRLRTAIGVLAIEAVDVVSEPDVTAHDARRAGFASRDALLASLHAPGPDRTLHRVRLRFAGPDPRVTLRDRAVRSATELGEIRARLARLDRASRHGPWTGRVLALIAAHPGVRAAELATLAERPMLAFKADVRKLKEIGLTESLDVGYRLSPRGRALVSR
jgi:hypothetical protein